MASKSLAEWLAWQETLNTAEIDLGLDRVCEVCDLLDISPPAGRVFTVAGTNGKGSSAGALEALLRLGGLRTGLYTSPHLVRYNERISIDNRPVADELLVAAFEKIERVRADIPLTFFEYGTLAAFCIFSEQDCDAWVLEVGLGGRLDAVNVIDPDVALITTVALDHQDWLGNTVEVIAREKAGIMRSGRPAFYGDTPVPVSVEDYAADIGAELNCYPDDFDFTLQAEGWTWQGQSMQISGLPMPCGFEQAQLRNQSLVLAALERAVPELLNDTEKVYAALSGNTAPGRMQAFQDEHLWLLDVAHNPQAAAGLAEWLAQSGDTPVTVVLGMLADKEVGEFVRAIGSDVQQWITCPIVAGRGTDAEDLADLLEPLVAGEVSPAATVEAALSEARESTPVGGRIVVCGSFYVVGPALGWLGLY